MLFQPSLLLSAQPASFLERTGYTTFFFVSVPSFQQMSLEVLDIVNPFKIDLDPKCRIFLQPSHYALGLCACEESCWKQKWSFPTTFVIFFFSFDGLLGFTWYSNPGSLSPLVGRLAAVACGKWRERLKSWSGARYEVVEPVSCFSKLSLGAVTLAIE